jgi:hypothetical protein
MARQPEYLSSCSCHPSAFSSRDCFSFVPLPLGPRFARGENPTFAAKPPKINKRQRWLLSAVGNRVRSVDDVSSAMPLALGSAEARLANGRMTRSGLCTGWKPPRRWAKKLSSASLSTRGNTIARPLPSTLAANSARRLLYYFVNDVAAIGGSGG